MGRRDERGAWRAVSQPTPGFQSPRSRLVRLSDDVHFITRKGDESRGAVPYKRCSAAPPMYRLCVTRAECHHHHELEGGVRVAAVKSLTRKQRQQPDGKPSPSPRSERSARSARAE